MTRAEALAMARAELANPPTVPSHVMTAIALARFVVQDDVHRSLELDTLTRTQARCTELLEEARALRAENVALREQLGVTPSEPMVPAS